MHIYPGLREFLAHFHTNFSEDKQEDHCFGRGDHATNRSPLLRKGRDRRLEKMDLYSQADHVFADDSLTYTNGFRLSEGRV